MNAFISQMRAKPDNRPITLKGIYEHQNGKVYGGYYYDRLSEDAGGASMTLKMPTDLRATLTEERLYTFKGSIEKKAKPEGVVELRFVVMSVERTEDSEIFARRRQQVRDLALSKRDGRYVDVQRRLLDQLECGKQPRVHMIFGETAIVDQDVTVALGTAASSYRLTTDHVSMEQPEQLGKAIFSKLPDVVVVAVIRGGGRLDALSDIDLARRIVESSSPCLVTALGHQADWTLLDSVADRSFSTPSQFGTYLANLASQAAARRERERQLQAENERLAQALVASRRGLESGRKTIDEEDPEAVELSSKLKTAHITLVLAVVLILWLIWG